MNNPNADTEDGTAREIRNIGLGAGAGAATIVAMVVVIELAPIALAGALAGACVYGIGRISSWW